MFESFSIGFAAYCEDILQVLRKDSRAAYGKSVTTQDRQMLTMDVRRTKLYDINARMLPDQAP